MSKLALTGALVGLFAAGVCHHSVHTSSVDTIAPEPSAVVPRRAPTSPAVTSSAGARARANVLGEGPALDAFARAEASVSKQPARVDSSIHDLSSDPHHVGTSSPSGPPVCKPGQIRPCTLEGKKGIEGCERDGRWSRCGLAVECVPGQKRTFHEETAGLVTYGCDLCLREWRYRCETPLVLSFDGAPVTFTDAPGSFDLRADGSPPLPSRWVSPTTPWLALDLDHSGAIEDARELFGSASLLPSGVRARHGFEALATHDDDHDGWLTPHDAIWPRLLLWTDTNQDRRSSPDELRPLSSRGITALAVSFREQPRCERGACERERGVVRFVDGQGREREGAVVDVHFGSP